MAYGICPACNINKPGKGIAKKPYGPVGPGLGSGPYGPGPDLERHVHKYSGRTSFDVGHSHGYAGVTGVNVGLAPHIFEGTTTFNDGHTHNYRGQTGPGIPISSGLHVHRYYSVTTVNGKRPHTHRLAGVTAPAAT